MPPFVDSLRTATVIGGGPGGLMAAEGLRAAGLAVTVFDHMPSVGRKFLLAGRGGLNLTHSEPIDVLLARYGSARPRLEPAVRAFGPDELRAWCADLGEATFVGSSGRVFPASFRATPLLRAWLQRLDRAGVEFRPRHRWLGWAPEAVGGGIDARRSQFSRADDTTVEVASDVTILALGGASWPRVGSDGGWVDILRGAGVEVAELRPSNVAVRVAWTDQFAARFAGVPLKNVAITVDGTCVRGDAMVSRTGLEGGPVYAHSAAIRRALDETGRCEVAVDLHPDLSRARVMARLAGRRPKDSLTTALRRSLGLAPVAIGLLREATDNRVPGEADTLAALVKAVPLTVEGTMPITRAISTAGGVSFAEVDDSFMLARVPGTFVVGEMLDWEAPTGGYLLQATFSTAVAAAAGAVRWLERSAMGNGDGS